MPWLVVVVGGWVVKGGWADVFKTAKPLVTGVAKDDRITLNSKDYTVLTEGQAPEPGHFGGGGRDMQLGRVTVSLLIVLEKKCK